MSVKKSISLRCFDIFRSFLPLIEAEEAIEQRLMTERLSTWDIEKLKKEGYCVTDVHGFWLDRTSLGRPVAAFRFGAGMALPSNCFT